MGTLQRLEAPTIVTGPRTVEENILRALENGTLALSDLLAQVDASPNETIFAATKVIANGRIRLVISEYVWGLEFALERVG